MRVLLALGAALCVALLFVPYSSAQGSVLIDTIRHLSSLQTESGGFRNGAGGPSEEASTKSTASAVFLTSLFGFKNQINVFEASKFLPTLENEDGGYGAGVGQGSDIESTRDAVLAFQHLALAPPSPEKTLEYISSLAGDDGLFGYRSGAPGDLESTVQALQAIEYLAIPADEIKNQITGPLKAYLAENFQGNQFFFPDESLDEVTANYYGILLASYVGFEIDGAAQIARWTQSQVNSASSVQGMWAAVCALHQLQPLVQENLLEGVSVQQFFDQAVRSLNDVALAYHAIAFTDDLKQNLDIQVNYEVLDSDPVGEGIVQGTKLKPTVSIYSVAGLPHSGLDVEVGITFGGSTQKKELSWNQEARQYVAYDFYEAGKLGPITFDYAVRFFVPGMGDITFNVVDARSVGYGIQVEAQAEHPQLRRLMDVGDEVAIGTEFKFGLKLFTQANRDIQSGDFTVIFEVLDSSNTVIHRGSVASGSALDFSYTLSAGNIPGGNLYFRFSVKDNALGVIHSRRSIPYRLNTRMLATEITFADSKSSYKIGEEVVVSIVPASFPDHVTVYTYDRRDSEGNDSAESRIFFMDIQSNNGLTVRSVRGSAVEDGDRLKIQFTVPIHGFSEALGRNQVAFRYGENVVLENYDSSAGEVQEDAVFFDVEAQLQLADVLEYPSEEDLTYGNVVSYKFKLHDALSGEDILRKNSMLSNAYLTVSHGDWVSVAEPTRMAGDYYTVEWTVSPNAIPGDGVISVEFRDIAGRSLAVRDENGEEISHKVKIGGAISVEDNVFAKDLGTDAAFIALLKLSANGKPLEGANLHAVLEGGGRTIAHATAAASPGGHYTASFILESGELEGRDYNIKIMRETEYERQLESSGATATTLATISVSHEVAVKPILPIRTEVIVLGALLLAFLAVSAKRP